MVPGDLILTPNWTWHEHTNGGDETVVWFDGLDVPLIDFYNAWVAEFGPVGNIPPDAGTVADEAYRQAGLMPDGADAGALPYSPMFRYPYDGVCAALAAMKADEDGARRLHYTNPATGRRVMPTMDVYMLDLAKGATTRPYRTTSNAMAVVAEGEGVTTAGDVTYRWKKNDVFTLPHNSWISHAADSEPARLFLNTDRALLADLGYLREEWG
jgi:gentisate 1,2-dioxygenase